MIVTLNEIRILSFGRYSNDRYDNFSVISGHIGGVTIQIRMQ